MPANAGAKAKPGSSVAPKPYTPKAPPDPNSYLTKILAKAKSVTPTPPQPGERMFGEKGKILDKIAGFLTGGATDPEFSPGPVDVAAAIPFGGLAKLLTEGFADKLLEKTSSRVLQNLMHNPLNPKPEYRIGSMAAREVAYGLSPEELLFSDPSWKIPSKLGILGIPRHDRRVAQDELYRISQRVLDELGIPAHETVTAFRGGPLYSPDFRLTPTSVNRRTAAGYVNNQGAWEKPIFDKMYGGPGVDLGEYEVPRTSVRALPGILSRGDDATISEMLIPSGVLRRSITDPSKLARDIAILPGNVRGVPSRLRRLLSGAY